MPTWNLTYRIGVNSTYDEYYRDEEALRSDPACIRYQSDQSFSDPSLIHVEIETADLVAISPRVTSILRSRQAEAVPTFPVSAPRLEVRLDASNPQEGADFLVGSILCIDANGRLGRTGNPLGVVTRFDNTNQQVQIVTSIIAPYGDEWRVEQDQFQQLSMVTRVDSMALRAQEQMRTDEDARVLAILDSVVSDTPPKPVTKTSTPPETRPVFKTRYQRIMETFED